MSRRDITVILERLSLDHRISLAEKACAYLQAVESNGNIKNHPSHAAICVDIASDQLSIEISRPALVRFSGSASPSEYNSTLQSLSRILTGSSQQSSRSTGSSSLNTSLTGNSRHAHMEQLLSGTSQTYLRQLAVQQGSIELVGLVLECLEHFFEVWVKSLPPAQRVHVKYSDAKWVGAAFWLCAMARGMTVGKGEEQAVAGKAQQAGESKPKVKKIGGRGGKELKDAVLTAVEHKVKKTELDNTIRLIEETSQEFLMSLRKTKGGMAVAGGERPGTLSAPLTPRKRKSSNNSDSSSSMADIVIPLRGGIEAQQRNPFIVNESSSSSLASASTATSSALNPVGEGRQRETSRGSDAYGSLGTKRTISNVSQISMASEGEGDDAEQEVMQQASSSSAGAILATNSAAKPPSKRKKLNSQPGVALTSSSIMSSSKSTPRRGLKETTAASQNASRILGQGRKTGGAHCMIPRTKYLNSKAFAQYQEWKARMLKSLASAG